MKQVVEKEKSTGVDKVIAAMAGQTFKAQPWSPFIASNDTKKDEPEGK